MSNLKKAVSTASGAKESADLGSIIATGRLPGKWGVLQDIAAVWVPEKRDSKILFRIRQVMSTVGILYAQRKQPEAVSPLSAYVEKHGLVYVDTNNEDLLCHHGIEKGHNCKLKPKNVPLTESESGPVMHVYTLPGGIDAHFYFSTPTDRMEAISQADGPYVKAEHEDQFHKAFADHFWAGHVYGMRFAIHHDLRKDQKMVSLLSMEAPGAFVSYSNTRIAMETITERCLAFQAHAEPRRLIFHGPPGTGKTTLARHVAQAVGGSRILRIESSALSSLSNTRLANVIHLYQPKALLLDDVDRNKNTVEVLLHFLENMKEGPLASLTVIATVNNIKALDPALLRPGRFDEAHKVLEPTGEHRKNVISYYVDTYKVDDVDLDDLNEKMDGFAPADIQEVISCVSKVGIKYLDDEIQRVRVQRDLFSGDRVAQFMAGDIGKSMKEDPEDLREGP